MGSDEGNIDTPVSRSKNTKTDLKRGEPGEFTRMFQIPAAPSAQKPDGRERACSDAIFGDIVPHMQCEEQAANTIKTQEEPAQKASASPCPGTMQGEFTKFFQSPLPASQPPQSPTGEFSDTENWLKSLEMETPLTKDDATLELAATAPTRVVPDNIPTGPSEFTVITAGHSKRPSEVASPVTVPTAPVSAPVMPMVWPPAPVVSPVFSAPAVPTPAPLAEAQPMPDSEARKKQVSYLPLIIIFNVLFVLAVLLILYFALRH